MGSPQTVFFFIHGAWSSPNCFNYLRLKLEDKYLTAISSYDCQTQSMAEIIESTKSCLYGSTKPTDRVIVVGHSLGGLVALALEKEERVSQVVTIASPLSGLHMNKVIEWFLSWKAPILHTISQGSSFLHKIQNAEFSKPISQIVAQGGFNPMINEQNDGVLTVASQDDWVPITSTITYVDASHFDILQHPDTLIELKKIGESNGV